MSYRLSVSIVVQREDKKILVVNNRRWGGFSVPGGKVEPGETFIQAARRELLEETGCEAVSIKQLTAYEHSSLQRDPEEVPWLCMGFKAEIGDQEPKQNEDGTTPEWKTVQDFLEKALYPGGVRILFDLAGIEG
jgi:8-oxo-dGTP diphosphatase